MKNKDEAFGSDAQLEKHAKEHHGLTLNQFKLMCNEADKRYEGQFASSVDKQLAVESFYEGFKVAIKEALEQQEGKEFFEKGKEIARWADKQALEQEPVELEEALKHCDGKDCECYAYYQGECSCDADWTPEEVVKLRYQLNNTHPHQWQGLTDDEIDKIYYKTFDTWSSEVDIKFANAIEQALRNKNAR